jgi:hypothetical protein
MYVYIYIEHIYIVVPSTPNNKKPKTQTNVSSRFSSDYIKSRCGKNIKQT